MGLVGCLARVELYWGLNDVHVDLNVLFMQCGSNKAKFTSKRNQSTYRASACTTCRYDHTNHHHLHIISLFSPSTSSVESNARTWTSQKILSATPPMLNLGKDINQFVPRVSRVSINMRSGNSDKPVETMGHRANGVRGLEVSLRRGPTLNRPQSVGIVNVKDNLSEVPIGETP